MRIGEEFARLGNGGSPLVFGRAAGLRFPTVAVVEAYRGKTYGRNELKMSALFVLDPKAVGNCTAVNKDEVLSALAASFGAVYGLDQDNILELLEERENLGSTGFGRGVAIPHARVEGLKRPVVAFLRLSGAVAFESADDMPVDLVFGLLSPAKSGAIHLHALAAISRMLRDDRMRDRLMDAPDNEAVYALLTSVADRDAA